MAASAVDQTYTTGTSTGIPAPIYTTTFDYHSYGQAAYRRRSLIPIRQSDMVVSLFPVTPHPGGAFSRSGAEVAGYGAAFVVANTGRPPEFFGRHRSLEATAELIVAHRATVLYGISGFVRRLLIHAERAKLDFSSVRMLMVSGEASSRQVMEDMRQRLLRLGSADALVINRYGSTEQGSSMVECTPGSGFHNLAPDQQPRLETLPLCMLHQLSASVRAQPSERSRHIQNPDEPRKPMT